MVQSGFYVGDGDWWVMTFFDIDGREDIAEVYEALLASGCPRHQAQEVCGVLSQWNKGYTWTDYDGRYSLLFTSKATSAEQMYDSIDHEKNHVVEHISTYYGVDPKSEEASYLAGELGRLLWPAAAYVLCTACHG